MNRVPLPCWIGALISVVTATPPIGQQAPAVTLERTEFHQLVTEDGATYEIYVALPPGYEANTGARYPVLYVLDGQTQFPLVRGVYQYTHGNLIEFGEAATPLIIVGLNRAGAQSYLDFLSIRTLDFTPTRSERQEARYLQEYGRESRTGGAGAFLTLLKSEIFPWVERRFRVSDDKGLYGFSLGGLFATYVLLTEPEMFNRYLIGSPSLWWDAPQGFEHLYDNPVMFRLEREYAIKHGDLAARVFISAGTEEPRIASPVVWLQGLLGSRKYPSLELEYHIFPDETHLSVIPATISRGLRYLYGDVP